jgi:nitrogen-specific signal transduction histidine kinase/ActR/RegA family two-component response regulator
VVFRDITEKRRFETELLRSSKLESLGVLAGGIAHDFNNILSIVLGNVSLCKMISDPNSEIHSRLSNAEKGCHRARDLTQQLLTFAKGGAPIRKAASIQEIVQESAAFAARGSGVICKHESDPDLWPVEADEGQISQVFNNLVINAVQAMPRGGSLKTRAKNCSVTEAMSLPVRPGRYVHIIVEDSGCGISSEQIGRIFDPYYTTKKNGSGLGLATTYAIIQKHDGCITVESRVGHGTTFQIYLPASNSAPQLKNAEPHALPKGVGRILVMDDELPIRDIARASLVHLGYEVDTAEHGNEALEKFQSAKSEGRPYTAVIMDLTVPGGMGGKETMERLLDIDPKVQAIVSSGYSHDPVMANYRDFGFAGVVEKPYKIESLAKALAAIIRDPVNRN